MRAVMVIGVAFVGLSALALRQVDARRRELADPSIQPAVA
jgi:hypothetical protein